MVSVRCRNRDVGLIGERIVAHAEVDVDKLHSILGGLEHGADAAIYPLWDITYTAIYRILGLDSLKSERNVSLPCFGVPPLSSINCTEFMVGGGAVIAKLRGHQQFKWVVRLRSNQGIRWGSSGRMSKSRVDCNVVNRGAVALNNRRRPSKSMDGLPFIDSSAASENTRHEEACRRSRTRHLQRLPGDALLKSYRPDLIMTDDPNDWVGSIQAKDGQGPWAELGGPNHHLFPYLRIQRRGK